MRLRKVGRKQEGRLCSRSSAAGHRKPAGCLCHQTRLPPPRYWAMATPASSPSTASGDHTSWSPLSYRVSDGGGFRYQGEKRWMPTSHLCMSALGWSMWQGQRLERCPAYGSQPAFSSLTLCFCLCFAMTVCGQQTSVRAISFVHLGHSAAS